MSDAFDPYYHWLGIPPEEQPPDHYRLLGIKLFAENPDVIEAAGNRQMGHLRTYQSGQHSELSQRDTVDSVVDDGFQSKHRARPSD